MNSIFLIVIGLLRLWECNNLCFLSKLSNLCTVAHSSPYYPFLKFIFNWRIIALQCCVGFCHTTMWNSHKYTYPLSLEPPSHPFWCLQVCSDSFYFMPDISNLCLFPLSVSLEVWQLYSSFQRQLIVSPIFSFVFLFLFSLIPALFSVVAFVLLALGLLCFSFSMFLRLSFLLLF